MATISPGPYSSLFNYDNELAWEQQRAEQKKQAEQKIMRTNAIGDALGLLIDSVGGSHGATINARGPNQYLMKSADRYRQVNDQLGEREQQLRLMDLAQREKDLNRGLGLQDKADDRKYQEGVVAGERAYTDQRTKDQRDWQEKQTAEARKWEDQQGDKRYKQQKDLAGIQAQNQMAMDRYRTDENIREYEARNRLGAGVARKDRSQKYAEDDILFQVPGTTQKIWIGNEELAEMAHQVIKEKQIRGEIITDPTLKAFMRNEQVKPTSLIESVTSAEFRHRTSKVHCPAWNSKRTNHWPTSA